MPQHHLATPDAYFVQDGEDRYVPTRHVQGAWRATEQHVAPLAGLLAHAVETHNPRPGLQLARLHYEILGVIALAPTQVRVSTIRRGRTIELVEATASIEGREVVSARGWRLATVDTSAVAGTDLPSLPDPQSWPVWDGTQTWTGGYIGSLEFRVDPQRRPGQGRMWLRSPIALLDGMPVGPVAAYAMFVDTANGVAVRADPTHWAFPNVDLHIDLWREPVPGWVGFDTLVTFGPTGLGLTSSVLHDIEGPVGRAQQMLTVRPFRDLT